LFCAQCRRGKHAGGRFILIQVNCRLRQRYRVALRRAPLETEPIVISTPYTD
jgi:hypothetical protein